MSNDVAIELFGSDKPSGVEITENKLTNLVKLGRMGNAYSSKLSAKIQEVKRLQNKVNNDPNFRKLKEARKEKRQLEQQLHDVSNAFNGALNQELLDFLPGQSLAEKINVLAPNSSTPLLNAKGVK
jgi:hypothetical protein